MNISVRYTHNNMVLDTSDQIFDDLFRATSHPSIHRLVLAVFASWPDLCGEGLKVRHEISVNNIVPLDIKRCICHFVKWQIHPFISKVTTCSLCLTTHFISMVILGNFGTHTMGSQWTIFIFLLHFPIGPL